MLRCEDVCKGGNCALGRLWFGQCVCGGGTFVPWHGTGQLAWFERALSQLFCHTFKCWCKDTFYRNLVSRRITAPIPFSLKLSSSLQNQHDFTSINSSKSATALDKHDVPQGSVLGPLLLLTEVFYPLIRLNPFLLCVTVYVTRHLAFSWDLHVNKRPFIVIHPHQLNFVY